MRPQRRRHDEIKMAERQEEALKKQREMMKKKQEVTIVRHREMLKKTEEEALPRKRQLSSMEVEAEKLIIML